MSETARSRAPRIVHVTALAAARSWFLVSAVALGAPAAALGQRPALNHVYVFIDSALYDSLRTSPWVRDTLATVREATVSDLASTWTGLYLFGRSTYLELYRAGPDTPPPGSLAMAFGTDTSGAIDGVESALRRLGRPVFRELRSRRQGADTLPWFHRVATDSMGTTGGAVRWWFMEYDAGYLARRAAVDTALRGQVDRRSYLARLFDGSRLLADLSALTVRVARRDLAHLREDMSALGLLTAAASPDRVVLLAADFRLVLIASDSGPAGLLSLELSLASPGAPRRIGAADLVLETGGGTALQLRAAASPDPSRCPLIERFVLSGGRGHSVCRGGMAAGPLVILESGLGDGYDAWGALLDSVATFARVLSYDRAGIGSSAPGATPRDARHVAVELREMLAALGERGPFVIVGHSLGGLFARYEATAVPGIRGMVLIDPTPETFAERQREAFGPERYAAYLQRMASRLSGTARAEWDAMDSTRAQLSRMSTPRLSSAVVLSAGTIENPDPELGPRMKRIWLDLHAQLATQLGGRQVVVPAGHYIHRTEPGSVVAAIREVTLSLER